MPKSPDELSGKKRKMQKNRKKRYRKGFIPCGGIIEEPRLKSVLGAGSRTPQGLCAGVFLQLFQRNGAADQYRYLGFI